LAAAIQTRTATVDEPAITTATTTMVATPSTTLPLLKRILWNVIKTEMDAIEANPSLTSGLLSTTTTQEETTTTTSTTTAPTQTMNGTADELIPQILDVGVKLKRLGRGFLKTRDAVAIVSSDILAWGVTNVVASHLKEPFKQRFQEYIASLSVEKHKLDNLGQEALTTLQSSGIALFELLEAEAEYQIWLAAFLFTRDINYILPLIHHYAKKTTLHDTLDANKQSLDMLGLQFGQTKHRFGSMLKGVPLGVLVSWSPAIWEGLSANEISEAKKVDNELFKLLHDELSDIKELLAEKFGLIDDLYKAEEREGDANGVVLQTTKLEAKLGR